jgi:hypothetical protein
MDWGTPAQQRRERVLLAVYANSPVNRQGTELADFGVVMGIGIALLGGLVFLLAVFGLVRSTKR